MSYIKDLFKKYNIHPTKLRGQNFLVSESVLKKIVDAAELTPDDTVLEIGPGLGMLTEALLERAGRVIAVETDQKLVEILREKLGERKNLEIIHGDILKFELYTIMSRSRPYCTTPKNSTYKLVANIPYNITSDILTKFLNNESRPEMLVLMVQKEVADRILETDGKPHTRASSVRGRVSRLSLFVKYFGESELIRKVPRDAFYPSPKVDSAVIKIKTHAGKYSDDLKKEKHFFEMVKRGFSSPRKKLIGNLKSIFKKDELETVFRELGFSLNIRPENLNLLAWQGLYEALTSLRISSTAI